ncbi:hypothetical protein JL722_11708 [Aureococcus anophagefferens]|nr:hypothetical protein JL722_11708 [Aureococcus anophagefferens]
MTAALRLLAAAATASAVSLASFDLDVASGLLTLSFDATVQSATLNISAVALQSNLTSAEERYRLTGITEDVFPASNSSSVVSVAMAEDDLLAVLFRRHLAVSEESTWLTLQPDSIRAVSGALADGQLRPVKVDDFTADDMQPSLEAFVFDMDGGVAFSLLEPVNRSTLDLSTVVLQTASNQNDAEASLSLVNAGASLLPMPCHDERTDNRTGGLSHDLWGTPYRGTLVTSDDAATLTLTLSADDLNEIKRVSRLAVDADTTNVYVEGTECYRDNAWPANYGIRTLPTNALGVETYVPDTTRPKLVSGSLDLDASILILGFDETVNASSLDIDRLSVQSTERDESTTERIALSSVATLGEDRGTRRASGASTNVSVAIGARDFAAMKLATSFGNGVDSTFFAALSGAVSDMAGNLLQEVPTSKGLSTSGKTSNLSSSVSIRLMDESIALGLKPRGGLGVVADSTPPTLDAFVLDLDGGALSLAFDEPVTRLSLDLTKIVLSADEDEDAESCGSRRGAAFADAHAAVYRSGLSLLRLAYEPLATAHGAEVLTVRLGAPTSTPSSSASLCTAAETTLLSGDDAWVADSATGNDAAALDFEAASNFTGDGTPPEVERAVLDLDGGILTIVADEPVRAASANASSFRLTGRADGFGAAVAVDVRTALAPDATDGTTLGFDVDCSTLDLLKIWGPGAPSSRTRSSSGRSLVGFDLESAGDYNITLRFDEPVASNTLDGSAWYLQRKIVELPAAHLVGGGGGRRGNALAALADGYAVELGPRVLSYTLDMDAGVLVLAFSEAVDVGTFDVTGLSLQAEPEYDRRRVADARRVHGRRGLYADACEPLVRLTLADGDVEDLRYMASLTRAARRRTSSPRRRRERRGRRRRDRRERPRGDRDQRRPARRGGLRRRDAAALRELRPRSGRRELTLTFDEPVRAASFDATRVQLRDAYDEADATSAVTLTTNSAPSADAYALVVALDGLDTSKIKSGAPLGQTRNQTFCAVRSAAAADCGAGRARGDNDNVARVKAARSVTLDVTPPAVSSFSLDLDKNDIVLEFDEPVNVSSVEPVERSLLLSSGQSRVEFNHWFGRCGSRCAPTTRTRSWRWAASAGPSSCYLSHGYALAEDAAAPPNVARSLAVEYALEASAILPDVTPPTLDSFELDLDAGLLTLTFDEVVVLPRLDVDAITVQSAKFNDGVATRTLSAANGTAIDATSLGDNTNGTSVVVALGRDDLDAVKALGGEGLSLDAASTYLSLAAGLVDDVNGNTAVDVFEYSAFGPAANWTRDSTPPRLLAFSKVSKTKKIMYLLFDEPVDHEAANLSLIAIADSEDGAETLYLDGADLAVEILDPAEEDNAEAPADALAPYSTTLSIYLGNAYATLPISDQDSTYVKLDDGAVADLGPALEAFALDMDAPATLTLQFTDGVVANASGLDVSAITLQAAYDADSGAADEPVAAVTLSDSVAYAAAGLEDADARLLASQLLAADDTAGLSDDGDRVVRVLLSETDAWKLQRAGQGLAKKSGATFISTTANLGTLDSDTSRVGDPNSVVATADDRAVALSASTFDRDATAPSLTNYTLDLDSGLLELHFDEPVKYRELNLSSLSLKTAQVQPYTAVSLRIRPPYYSDPRGLYDACDDAAGNTSEACTYARVRLSDRDFDDVRAAAVGAWMDVDRTAAADASGNRVAKTEDATSSPSIPVGALVKDAQAPELEAFSLDLDGDGFLYLNFSEPVNPQSLNTYPGVKALTIRLLRDLADLKQTIASNPFIDGIGQSVDSTFLEATAAEIRMDTTGPRLAGYDYLEGTAVYLYFNEPLSGTGFNVSTLLFRADANATAAPVKLTDSTLLLDNDCVVKIAVSATDAAALSGAGVARGVFLQHLGGFADDVVGGVAALEGRARRRILDMSENKLYIRYYHDVDADNINVTAVVVAASDSADAWSYRLTNATSEMYVAYDGKGEGVVQINLGAADVAALKLADGAAGVAALGTTVYNTMVGLDASFIRSVHGRPGIPRVLGDAKLGGVKTFQMVPDNANPTVTRCDVDMDLGVLTIELDEPVRASEAEVTYITVSQTAAGGASFTLTSATAPRRRARRRRSRSTSATDLDELKRLDHLAMNASTTHVSWLSSRRSPTRAELRALRLLRRRDSGADAVSVLDLDVEVGDDDYDAINDLSRLAKDIDSLRLVAAPCAAADAAGNPLTEIVDGTPLAPSTFAADATAPELLRFSVDMDRGTLTLNFTETVRFGSLDATKLEFYSTDDVDGGGDAVALSDSTTEASLEQFDDAYSTDDDAWYDDGYYGAANASAIATDRSTTFLSAEEGAVTDMTGNDLAATTTRGSGAGYAADATQPQLASFDLDMDAGTLDLEFSEAVDVGTLTFELLALSTDGYATGGVVLTAAEATATRGDGKLAAQVALDLGDANVDALKVARVGTDGDSAWLAAAAGAVDDMDGLPLVRIAPLDVSGGAPLQASRVVADDTVPVLLRVGFDAPDLILLYDEPVDIDTVQPNKLRIVTPEGVGDNLNEALAAYGASNEELVIDISAQCGQPATCDLFYNATNVTNATMLRIEASSPLIEVAVAELQRIGPTLVASGADLHDVVCSLKECDLAKAYVIDKYDSINVVAAAGFVKDFAANSADNSGVVALTDPECACASGTYITLDERPR